VENIKEKISVQDSRDSNLPPPKMKQGAQNSTMTFSTAEETKIFLVF
jgi:hypothetical protein